MLCIRDMFDNTHGDKEYYLRIEAKYHTSMARRESIDIYSQSKLSKHISLPLVGSFKDPR